MLQNQSRSKGFNVVKIRQTQAAEHGEDSRFSSSKLLFTCAARMSFTESAKQEVHFCTKTTSPAIKRRIFGVSDEIQTADFLNIS
jgi:hypothetical protein